MPIWTWVVLYVLSVVPLCWIIAYLGERFNWFGEDSDGGWIGAVLVWPLSLAIAVMLVAPVALGCYLADLGKQHRKRAEAMRKELEQAEADVERILQD